MHQYRNVNDDHANCIIVSVSKVSEHLMCEDHRYTCGLFLSYIDRRATNYAEKCLSCKVMNDIVVVICICRLEAFAVDDSGAGFVVLLLGDPHLLEGGEGSQDGASDPDGVLSLGRSDDLDLHGGRSEGGDLLLHTIGDTGVHGRATGEDGVGVEILTDVDVALHDAVEASLVDSDDLHSQESGAEHGLRATETLVADGHDL